MTLTNEERFEVARVIGNPPDRYHSAQVLEMKLGVPLVSTVMTRIAEMLGCRPENEEPPRIIRYEEGGEFKLHYDSIHPDHEDYPEQMTLMGGQRIRTCMIYLNDTFKGGETWFPMLDLKVVPELGKALIWDNVGERGEVDGNSLHAALPVTKGQKYILVTWERKGLTCIGK